MFLGFRKKDANPRERAVWGDLMSLGLVFPIAIATGFFVGRWVGGLLGHPRIGMAVGLVWGVATAFWELYKVTVRLNRLDDPGAPGKPDAGRNGERDRHEADHEPRS